MTVPDDFFEVGASLSYRLVDLQQIHCFVLGLLVRLQLIVLLYGSRHILVVIMGVVLLFLGESGL